MAGVTTALQREGGVTTLHNSLAFHCWHGWPSCLTRAPPKRDRELISVLVTCFLYRFFHHFFFFFVTFIFDAVSGMAEYCALGSCMKVFIIFLTMEFLNNWLLCALFVFVWRWYPVGFLLNYLRLVHDHSLCFVFYSSSQYSSPSDLTTFPFSS